MVLPELVPVGQHVWVQHTSFSVDAVARHVCSTWREATQNGGPAFTSVVVGGGMYGAYLAARIFRRHPGARVLLLDAGPFLLPEHVQNLGPIGLDVPAAIPADQDPGIPRATVWGLPWRGNVDFPGLAYCSGGKSLYWGGWCPRLTPDDLAQWPADVGDYLQNHYSRVESDTGVEPGTDFIDGDLLAVLRTACVAAAATTPGVETDRGDNGVEGAPLAVQGDSPASGLFSFDKFSSLPLLMNAIRDDIASAGHNDAARRLFLVPRAHVIRAHVANGTVHALELDVAGERHMMPIPPNCALALTASSIESTRLALHSFPSPLMGRNLMGHLRSDFTVRINRAALDPVAPHVQTAALLVRGSVPSGRFHIQITASNSRDGSDSLLFRMIPDMDLLEAQLANTDPEWVTLTFRALGEMHGDRLTPVHGPTTSWIDLSPYEVDEFGVPRAYVHIVLGPDDATVWRSMDETAVTLAQGIAGSPGSIEYYYDGAWQSEPFPLERPFPSWRRGLGTTYHESGTLWMGKAAATSVTDTYGRFHEIANAYACDQSIFPTVGSANPVLTGLALARRLADHLTP